MSTPPSSSSLFAQRILYYWHLPVDLRARRFPVPAPCLLHPLRPSPTTSSGCGRPEPTQFGSLAEVPLNALLSSLHPSRARLCILLPAQILSPSALRRAIVLPLFPSVPTLPL